MSDETTATPTDGLWSRLRLIEGQPLAARADAYTTLHDDLFRRLETGTRVDSREKNPSGHR
ncbi:MAG: hypothetical protein ACTH8F_10715 [Microbacterium sp.]|uniref:hypothetical protein n=1 Tax=Microbacterium sp. TaxID=51671 RepID=UPI003F973166